MRSGRLVHTIEVHRSTIAVNDCGTPESAWMRAYTLRAELVEKSTEEIHRNAGDTSETVVVFRTRFVEGITMADRVLFEGTLHGIEGITRVGRKAGLELRCKLVTP